MHTIIVYPENRILQYLGMQKSLLLWSVFLLPPPLFLFLWQLWWLQMSPTWCSRATEGLLRALNAYCVTAPWLNGKPRGCRGNLPPHLWPVPHLTLRVLELVVLEQLQLSSLCLSIPPLDTCRQCLSTRCLYANTKTCMDILHTNTYNQTDTRGRTTMRCFSITTTLWLSALHSKLWSTYVVLYEYIFISWAIWVICVYTCSQQFKGIHV